MAMTLTSITNAMLSKSLTSQSTGVKSSDNASQAFGLSNTRTAQKLESTKVQLSSYGQIKSAVADVQTTANTLTDTKKTASVADAKKAIQSFVESYNKANSAISTATQASGKQTGALASDSRAKLAGSDLRSALSQGSTSSDLKKLGVTQNTNGTLSIDTKALDTALQNSLSQAQTTLSNVGAKVAATAERELSKSGNIGSAVNTLTQRSATLEAQQTSQQALATASQQAVQQVTAQYFSQASGAEAYMKLYTS